MHWGGNRHGMRCMAKFAFTDTRGLAHIGIGLKVTGVCVSKSNDVASKFLTISRAHLCPRQVLGLVGDYVVP